MKLITIGGKIWTISSKFVSLITDWILSYGKWDDLGVWRDHKFWQDNE